MKNHDLFSRPDNLAQAAYACLHDYFMDHIDTPNWEQMETVLNEK